jgi:two-component system, NarL family, response regulator DesR
MIRIVFAEDRELLFGVIGSLLDLEEDMVVVGQAKNREDALSLVTRLQPDICILDSEMPEMNGIEAADALMQSGCNVIILTTFAREGYYIQALKAGVRGYLLKDSPSEELISSIRSIMNGKLVYSPDLMDDEENVNERGIDIVGLNKKENTNEASNQQSNTSGIVRSYLTTIMDKIKLPAG